MTSPDFPVGQERPIKALATLLKNIIESPAPHLAEAGLGKALNSQGGLAKYANEALGIKAMSLNHQKKLANAEPGAYSELDRLRKTAAIAMAKERTKTKPGSTQTKEGLHARVRELEDAHSALLQDMFLLQRAYDLRCIQARSYAQAADAATQARCAKEQQEIDASFSLLKNPRPSDRVTSINSGRRGKHV